MVTMARAGAGRSQDARTLSWSSTRVQEPGALAVHHCVSPEHWQGAGAGEAHKVSIWNANFTVTELTCYTTILTQCSYTFFVSTK